MSRQALANEASAPIANMSHLPQPRAPGLASEFHRWPLPGYIWPALERCYRSIYCSESQLRISGCLTPRIEAWVARQDGSIAAVILFDRYQHHVRVLNEVITLSTQMLREFADAVFGMYPKLHLIFLRAIKIEGLPKQYVSLSVDMSDDYFLKLPTHADQWRQSLSASAREKLRYYLRRAQRRAPSFSFRIRGSNDMTRAQINQVIHFNRARMRAKGKRYGMGAAEEYQLCQLMLERGQLFTIEIDDEIKAGLLCTLIAGEVFMHVIAHDPACDDLRLGFLCCALAIEETIAQGHQQFHFLWGQYDYKTRLGAERVVLSQVLMFRYGWSLVWQPRHLLAFALASARAWVRRQRQR